MIRAKKIASETFRNRTVKMYVTSLAIVHWDTISFLFPLLGRDAYFCKERQLSDAGDMSASSICFDIQYTCAVDREYHLAYISKKIWCDGHYTCSR